MEEFPACRLMAMDGWGPTMRREGISSNLFTIAQSPGQDVEMNFVITFGSNS